MTSPTRNRGNAETTQAGDGLCMNFGNGPLLRNRERMRERSLWRENEDKSKRCDGRDSAGGRATPANQKTNPTPRNTPHSAEGSGSGPQRRQNVQCPTGGKMDSAPEAAQMDSAPEAAKCTVPQKRQNGQCPRSGKIYGASEAAK